MSDLTILSAVLFALALTVTTTLHEAAHAIVSRLLGGQPVLFSTLVRNQEMPPSSQALTAAAGPVFSLAQGVVLFALYGAIDSSSTAPRLFVLWMALHGLVNFFGYLITVPFAPLGDLGRVARYLGLGTPGQLAALGVGLLANTAIGLMAREPFLRLAAVTDVVATASARTEFLFEVTVLPWLVGAVVVTLARPRPPAWVSAAYPFLSGMFTIVAWRTADDSDAVAAEGSTGAIAWWPWLVALAVAVAFSRLVLDRGVRLGQGVVSGS